MKEKKIIGNRLTALLAITAGCLALYGYQFCYLENGKPLNPGDVIYYSLALFFMDTVSQSYDLHWTIEVARLLAPLSLWTLAITFLSRRLETIANHFRSLMPNSVVVYGSNELANLAAAKNRWIFANDVSLWGGKRNVILMNNDDDSFRFFRDHHKKLEKNQVYIGLQDMPSYLLRKNSNVFFFNVYEEIARNYWNTTPIQQDMQEGAPYRIVIVNYRHDGLGYALLKYGILNNVFPGGAQVHYDVITDTDSLYLGFENLELMNADTLSWHEEPWSLHAELLRSADRIILADGINPQALNQLISVCTHQKIDFYTPREITYPQEYKYDGLRAFGITEQILNKTSILKEGLFQEAKELHYEYLRKNGSDKDRAQIAAAQTQAQTQALMDDYWGQLDGFVKNSNIAAADYRRNHMAKPDPCTPEDIEALAQAEHIRWCRFHFLNGWRHATPEKGARKNERQRIHRDLVPWEALPEGEREKNRHQVRMELGMKDPAGVS